MKKFMSLLMILSTPAFAQTEGIELRRVLNTVEEVVIKDAAKLTKMISKKVGYEIHLSELECSQHESGLKSDFIGICTVNAATSDIALDFLVTFRAMVNVSDELFPKPPLPPTEFVILDAELIHED
jgi:hypothetical protein